MIEDFVAGDPMNEKIKWVKLTRHEISQLLKKAGYDVSRNIVRKLLKKNNFVKRKIQRKTSTGTFKDRDEQFKEISLIKNEFMKSENPVLSVDTKKKEYIGNLHRDGEVYCTQAIQSYDHDFKHLSEGKIVPHGIYDIKRNEGFINIGVNNETAFSITDSVKKWWNRKGKNNYPNAKEILMFFDAGGANSYRHNIFKHALQELSNKIQLPVRICHYPPYASKWNPIEHRVFPHVTRAMQGVKLESVEDAKNLIKKTTTKTGLKVVVDVTKKIYRKGLKVGMDVVEKINIEGHGRLDRLNYTISPTGKC